MTAPDETPGAFLARRARAASDGRLALDAGVGLAAAAGLAIWQPPAWGLWLAIAVAQTCFGLWGIADRSAADSPPESGRRQALLAARAAAAGLGAAGAVAALVGLLFLALGTWIS
jgi:hypothetical protein